MSAKPGMKIKIVHGKQNDDAVKVFGELKANSFACFLYVMCVFGMHFVPGLQFVYYYQNSVVDFGWCVCVCVCIMSTPKQPEHPINVQKPLVLLQIIQNADHFLNLHADADTAAMAAIPAARVA